MKKITFSLAVASLLLSGSVLASHAWADYHWARSTPSFTLKLGDNLSSQWHTYLATASSEWSLSSVLDTNIVPGFSSKNCRATSGRVEVCNRSYGNNGWLGLASIWLTTGDHIYQGTVKLNDTYFNTAQYNTPAWRNLVVCQEVAHTFGLDHQDTIFDNPNLGTCMDYTNDPDGSIKGQLSNTAPNAHDYEELGIIYAHLDNFTTLSQGAGTSRGQEIGESRADWGKAVGKDAKGRDSVFEKDLGGGNKVLTHVFWAE